MLHMVHGTWNFLNTPSNIALSVKDEDNQNATVKLVVGSNHQTGHEMNFKEFQERGLG